MPERNRRELSGERIEPDWDILKRQIEKEREDWRGFNYGPEGLMANFYRDELVDYEGQGLLDSDEYGSPIFFKDIDGGTVRVLGSTNEAGLRVVDDAIFINASGKEILKISDILPKEWIILQEGLRYNGGVKPGLKIMIVEPNFLGTIGGRITFLHELGHALDYQEKPESRKEFIDRLHNFDDKTRERNAWKKAAGVIKILRENKGFNFLSSRLGDSFERSPAWRQVSRECTEQHNYKAQTEEEKNGNP